MTQPAKAQEPSMEEILASIRRIISDDEAKPAASTAPAPTPSAPPIKAEAPKPEPASRTVAQAARPQVMAGIPPSKIAPPRPAAAAPSRAPAAPAPVPAKNSQAEIDAMLAGFDTPAPAAKAAPAKAAEPEAEEVFELTEQMAVQEPPSAPFNKIEPENDVEFAEASVAQVATHRSPEPPAFDAAPAVSRAQLDLMSGSTVSAVETAFGSLTSTVLSNNARTLEDLVKEMMRPMLKSWLDDNLPNLVERIVKSEIERVSRGR